MSTHVPDRTVSIPALLPGRLLGIVSMASVALATIPPSSIVGAILWTGYFSNIVVTHLPIV